MVQSTGCWGLVNPIRGNPLDRPIFPASTYHLPVAGHERLRHRRNRPRALSPHSVQRNAHAHLHQHHSELSSQGCRAAHSVKRLHPEAVFHVVLSDKMPVCPAATTAAFDNIIHVAELPIENLPSWIFKHRLVELCTAVKGTAFQYIASRFGAERIYYFDPDILVLNRLDDLERMLDRQSILLTPHQSEPDTDFQAILDNEHCCMRHGVFNLGFLAVRMAGQGRQFIDWWAERLRAYCYDEVEAGLFTDQKWVDLAPAFFDDIAIVRDPQYNVSTWNLTHRRAAGRAPTIS